MQSDEELIEELRQGIQSSMEVLIKRHYKAVFAYIYRYSGDYHTSYDLTQETFIKMVRSIHSYGQIGGFRYWLLKIALNVCRDYFKSKSYKTGKDTGALVEEPLHASSNIIDMLDRKLENAAVKAAVMELPSFQRETIILRFYHDLKIKEIADLTDAEESTVKSRIRQGLAKLKSIMERGEHDENRRQTKETT